MCKEDIEISKLEGFLLGLHKALEIAEMSKAAEQIKKEIKTEIKKASRVVADDKVGEIEAFISMALELRYTEQGIEAILS